MERRARSRRLLLVVGPLAVVAVAAVAYWASARLGLAQVGPGLDWPVLGLALGTGGAAMVLWPRYDTSLSLIHI